MIASNVAPCLLPLALLACAESPTSSRTLHVAATVQAAPRTPSFSAAALTLDFRYGEEHAAIDGVTGRAARAESEGR